MTESGEAGGGTTYGARLPRRRLGRSGIEVPAVALGGYPMGRPDVGDEEAVRIIRFALEQGITHLDTSPGYAESERRIGLALEGVRRDAITISTKTGTHPEHRGDYSRDGTMWSVENSLAQLRTDTIDVLLVHDPGPYCPDGLGSICGPDGALAALEGLKEQGVIRAIGLGEKRFDLHREAIESGRFDVILTFGNYTPIDTTAADWLLPLAARHDVGVFNGSPMFHGLLCGEDPDEMDLPKWFARQPGIVDAARRLYRWCRDRDVSMPAVVFQFAMRQPLIHCTLTGVKMRAELEENLRAATTPLPESIWDELAALNLTGWT